MKNNQQVNKFVWADNLRVIATIAVIFLHASADVLYKYGFVAQSSWWICNVYDSSVRFCVPIFVMLTGTLMLPKEYELRSFLKKTFYRIVLPFLFWSLIYMLHNLYAEPLEEISFAYVCKWVLFQLKFGTSYHLWYIYMIIGIYLFIPIISKWVRNATDKEIRYFLIIWFLTMILNQPFISKYVPNFNLSYFGGFIGYLILGYYLTTREIANKKRTIRNSIFLILAGVIVIIFGTYFLTEAKGSLNELLYDYLSPPVLILSIGVFMLVKNISITNRRMLKAIAFISKYSFGIYLIHVLVLIVLSHVGISCDLINPIIGVPITVAICLTLSAGLIFCLHKLPLGKYIAG